MAGRLEGRMTRSPMSAPVARLIPGDHACWFVSGARQFIDAQALRAGLRPEQAMDLCIAADEVLTSALVHGAEGVTLAAWAEDGRFVCQVSDQGEGIADPLAGYRPPGSVAGSGRCRWIVRQLVDLLQISPGPPGTTVRLHMRRA
jgi:anti-sigma regulatory factor (Ser/Thr protein kinase)